MNYRHLTRHSIRGHFRCSFFDVSVNVQPIFKYSQYGLCYARDYPTNITTLDGAIVMTQTWDKFATRADGGGQHMSSGGQQRERDELFC